MDTFRTAGIIDADLDDARALLQGLLSADDAQETALNTKKDLTAAKDAAQLRIERAVVNISAVGTIAFRKAAAKRAVFEKLVPKTAKKEKPEAKEAPAKGAN